MNKPMVRRSIVTTATATALAVASGDALADFSSKTGSPTLSYHYDDTSWKPGTVGGFTFGAGYTVSLDTSAGLDDQGQPTATGSAQLDVPVTFFSRHVDLFAMSGDIDAGAGTADLTVTVLGHVVDDQPVQLPQKLMPFAYAQELVQVTEDFEVGPIPVTVTASAVGMLNLGVDLIWQNGKFSFIVKPNAAVAGDLSAGTGATYDGFGASAGVDGSMVVLSLQAPLTASSTISSNAVTTKVTGSLGLNAMSGDVDLYAEVCIPYITCDKWTQPIFNWNGISSSTPLFNDSQTHTW
jgi:hypothetical protein